MKRIVLVTGGFDPLHSGHIAYLESARKLGDVLVVGLNSDAWLVRKKTQAFMPMRERAAIMRALACVDFVIDFRDEDGTACHAIEMVRASYPQDRIIFANGGDRTANNIPEMSIQDNNIEFQFGVGGEDKKNSSSWILQDWKSPRTERPWGYYRVLHTVGDGVKVKELTVEPHRCLSMQRHEKRAEFWFVAEGTATVYSLHRDCIGTYYPHDHVWINRGQWHQLWNETDQPLRVIEIQFGAACEEDDIERHL
jgi:D-beta-D-heptose 7-phosphate kinase/D-beta-D-heptose 1-phosphate adenosyltransferase